MQFIGQSFQRIDAQGKVNGQAMYPGDIHFDNQLYLKTLFSEYPHAIINNIDISLAEKMDGVITILTARDVPNNEYGLIVPDQPVLCGPGSLKPYADRVRFIGDQVAVVVAETEEIGSQACKNIKVSYELLQIIDNPHDALKDNALRIHPEKDSNIFWQYRIRRGDTESAFERSDVIVESEYQTPAQEHAYLQPEAGLAYVDDEGVVTVIVAGQWTHEDQEQIAHALDLPIERVRVIYPAIGGAFGGREDMSVQIVLALAAIKLQKMGINRPVKTTWSRQESIVGHHKRHPYKIKSKWGATKEGKIISAQVNILTDAGAYGYTSSKVMGNATLMCTGPYDIPNVEVDSFAVYTNNLPNGAFRGFGGPQAAFAAETQMNKLAEKLGLDPVEIRMRNLLAEGVPMSVGTPLPKGISIQDVVDQCARSSGWTIDDGNWKILGHSHAEQKGKDYLKRGIGIACAYKNIGFSFGAPEQCQATIELFGNETIEEVILRHAGAEVGQGSHSIFIQMAAEALGLPMDKIRLVASDTATTGNSGSVSASRMTFMAGNSIIGAAKLALEKWNNEERPAVAHYQYKPPATTPYDPETGASNPNFAYGYVAESVEVEVDTETGHIRVVNVVCVDDVGHSINPTLIQGQIDGAIVQAEGYAIQENFIQEGGKVFTPTLSTYLIPTILDIPENVTSIILEIPDPNGPWGARGVGEMPFLPFTPALTAAIHSATGVWIDPFPFTPERVLRSLGKLE